MPMDCDDNDFQGQNHHLAGEGSSKFSPVLKPYALPKFDFDDSLQGHLRFDSLVENEVFLGIPGQEDNQWIDDFSRGSNGIEFSSSAAEPCSIARHNNVWSEATSSESVEMLLKSVGQEEMVPGETIIEESDACEELGALTEQMEHYPKQGSGTEDVLESRPALPSDDVLGNLSRSSDVEGTSQVQETEISLHEYSCDLDQNAVETSGTIVIEKNVGAETKCDDANTNEVQNSAKDLLVNEAGKNPSSGMNSSSQDAVASLVVLNHQGNDDSKSANFPANNTGDEVQECLIPDKEGDENDKIRGSAVDTVNYVLDNPPRSSSEGESGEIPAIGTDIGGTEEPSCLPLDGDNDLQTTEECGQDVCSMDPDQSSGKGLVDMSDSAESQIQLKAKMDKDFPVIPPDSKYSKKHAEVSNSNAETCSSSEIKSDETNYCQSDSAGEKKTLQGIDGQLDCEASVGNLEASLSSPVENNICQSRSITSSHLGDFSTPAGTPTELLGEKQAFGNVKGMDDSCGIPQDLNAEDPVLSSTLAGNMQIAKESLVSGQDDQDASLSPEGNDGPSTKSSNVEVEHVGSYRSEERPMSAPQDKVLKLDGRSVHESEHETNAGNKAVPNLALEATELMNVTCEKPKASLLPVEPMTSEEKEKVDVEVLKESSGSSKESLKAVVEPCPVPTFGKAASHDSARELLHEAVDRHLTMEKTCGSVVESKQQKGCLHGTVDHSLPMTETSDAANVSEQVKVAKTAGQNCSDKLEVSLISEVKEGSRAEGLVVPGNNHQAASAGYPDVVNKIEMLMETSSSTCFQSSSDVGQDVQKGGGNSGEPECGILMVVSHSEIAQTNQGKKEEEQESTGKNATLSEAVKVDSTFQNPSGSGAVKVDWSFTRVVSPSERPSKRQNQKDLLTSPVLRASKKSVDIGASPSTPVVSQMVPKMASDISCTSSKGHEADIVLGGPKDTPDRKTRPGSGKARGKDGAKKGSARQSERGKKSSSAPMSLSGSSQLVQIEGLKSYGNVDHSGAVSSLTPVSASNLPDLNASTPSSSLFQQPFTDLQQVQLRAQIFVYGSLIQGAAPDDACMVSAFGASDGGRSVWEPVWRACVERLQRKKLHINKSETPVQLHSGARPPDQLTKQGVPQSNVLPSPVGRTSSKDTPSPVVNSIIPLSSPLWNISTPSFDGLHSGGIPRNSFLDYHQAALPLHPYQIPPSRSFGHNTSWLSQGPFPGPWVTSPQTSAFDANAPFSGRPMTETVKLTPIKDSLVPVPSGAKHGSLDTSVQIGSSSVSVSTSSLPEVKKTTVLPGQCSAELKSKKRKKALVSEDIGQRSLPTQTQTGAVSTPISLTQLSTSLGISSPSFISKGHTDNIVKAVTSVPSTDHPKKGGKSTEHRVLMSEDSSNKVEEAKQQAENAAALAAAAVSNSQSVWSQLGKQKSSKLISDVEAKLASAAVAIAAAASVARAAAAAAKIASNAALQAKLMADEALSSMGTGNPAQGNAASLSDVVNNLGKADPASILKGGDESNSSNSIIVAAREVARRRVETASAASRHAENLDAIVKAAELAADAVSQAGKVVVMGDPLPLSQLVEAGPDGYWRVPQMPLQQVVMLSNMNREQCKAAPLKDFSSASGMHCLEGQSEKEKESRNHGLSPLSKEMPWESMATPQMATMDGSSALNVRVEKDAGGHKHRRASHLTEAIVPESEIGSMSASVTAEDILEKETMNQLENRIKEGCIVEVFKEGFDSKVAWFSATVSNLKDGKAFVHYTALKSDEGSGPLKEWVALEGEGHKAPKIRIPHPMTITQLEGTRKRRRAAMGDYVFSNGDKVDVWIQNHWREGVVLEKNKKDETTLTVYFPAEGETLVVRAWHLRPTLVWSDGKWIEWSSSRGKDRLSQGDTPQEKRLKMGSSAIESKEKDKILKDIELVKSGKPEEPQLLPLSAGEKVFNVGKNREDENKADKHRTTRMGLQKEGSRVIFGVPKPGKKRKFMEVSKHYVAERNTKVTSESNNSVKVAKDSIPQGTASRGWKNNFKIDSKEKRAAESKTNISRSVKPPNISSRILPQKDKVLAFAVLPQQEDNAIDHVPNDSYTTNENGSGQQNMVEFGSSNPEGGAEGPILFSSRPLPSDAPPKKMPLASAKSERLNDGKLAPSGGRLARVEVKDKVDNMNSGKSNLEVVEPRRSNRRIQPTSRLLEGLQSSLIISKIPSVSHDKSHRSQHRGNSKGNAHG